MGINYSAIHKKNMNYLLKPTLNYRTVSCAFCHKNITNVNNKYIRFSGPRWNICDDCV